MRYFLTIWRAQMPEWTITPPMTALGSSSDWTIATIAITLTFVYRLKKYAVGTEMTHTFSESWNQF